MSESHTWLGALACEVDSAPVSQLKSCPSKFGATGNAWVESVVALYFRPALARSPSARISFWMRLRLPL